MPQRTLKLLSRRVVLLAAAIVLVLGIASLLLLLHEANKAVPASRPALRIDAIKTGLSVVAGAAALAALVLAVRRQWLAELTHVREEEDRSERRVTELYVAAVEQLGSDKAAVRLGGLHALQRLGQINADQRQVIIDVICSYLRMPFSYDVPIARRYNFSVGDADMLVFEHSSSGVSPDNQQREELQVRLAAQRILSACLKRQEGTSRDGRGYLGPAPWADINLNLAGAFLVDFSLRGAVISSADFEDAVFFGPTRFDGLTVSKGLKMVNANFRDAASFEGAKLSGRSDFEGARFESAFFERVVFDGEAIFNNVSFGLWAMFGYAQFLGPVAWFSNVKFGRFVAFLKSQFSGDALFEECMFAHKPLFDESEFLGEASFVSSHFDDGVSFDKVVFEGCVRWSEKVAEAESSSRLLDGAIVRGPGHQDSRWPAGWRARREEGDKSIGLLTYEPEEG